MKRVLASAALVLVAFLTGCGKDNPAKPTPPASKYVPSSTPFSVLYNMQIAYVTRDSTGYDSLFDAAYAGSSIDQTDLTPTLFRFTKADEAQHIAYLAHTNAIISMVFPPGLIRGRDSGDPPGWALVQISGLRLEIDGSRASSSISGNEAMEFTFAPTSPSPGSPTDTTWHIVRWTEVKL